MLEQSATLAAFLTPLIRGGQYVDLRFVSDTIVTHQWERPSTVLATVERLLPTIRQNFYIGINPTYAIPPTNAKGQEKPPNAVGSRVEYIAAVNALFADLDGKDFDPGDWRSGKNRAIDLLGSLPLAPSWVNDTGGGLHIFLLLDQPYLIHDQEQRSKIAALQRAWTAMIAALGGDNQTSDLARAARIPGSFNFNHGDPLEVKPFLTDGPIYTADELFESIPWGDHFRLLPAAGSKNGTASSAPKSAEEDPLELLQKYKDALAGLDPARADEYEFFYKMVFILRPLGDLGNALYHQWAAQSDKYNYEEAQAKWDGNEPGEGSPGLASLIAWAKEDQARAKTARGGLPELPKKKDRKIQHYREALHALGYTFRFNKVSLALECNGVDMTDLQNSVIMGKCYDARIGPFWMVDLAIDVEAKENEYNPIQDYLENCAARYDGSDYISQFVSFLTPQAGFDPGDMRLYFERWLRGAVRRVYQPGAQNPALILTGDEGIGKSTIPMWLCSQISQYFISAPLYEQSKDNLLSMAANLIFDLSEMDGIVRKADVATLKDLLTKEIIQVRPPYGKRSIHVPVLCSFFGSVNQSSFLARGGGLRRFRVIPMQRINFGYQNALRPDQIWGQAVAEYKAGQPVELNADQRARVNVQTAEYIKPDVLEDYIALVIEFTGEEKDVLASAAIIEKISSTFPGADKRKIENDLVDHMQRMGAVRGRYYFRDPDHPQQKAVLLRGYRGIKFRNPTGYAGAFSGLIQGDAASNLNEDGTYNDVRL